MKITGGSLLHLESRNCQNWILALSCHSHCSLMRSGIGNLLDTLTHGLRPGEQGTANMITYSSPGLISSLQFPTINPPRCSFEFLSRTTILSSNDHHTQSGSCCPYRLRFTLQLIPFVHSTFYSGQFPSSSPQRPMLATIALTGHNRCRINSVPAYTSWLRKSHRDRFLPFSLVLSASLPRPKA